MNTRWTINSVAAGILHMPMLVAADIPKTEAKRALSLRQAIALASDLEPRLRQAKSQAEAADAAASTSWAGMLPEAALNIEMGTARDRAPLPGESLAPESSRDHNIYKGEVEVKFNLFRGWGDIWEQRAATAAAETARAQQVSIASEVIRDVTLLYFSIQVEQMKRSAEVEARQLREKQLEEVKNRAAAGKTNRLDLLRAEFTYKQRLPEIRRLEFSIRERVLQLIRMIGGELNQELILADDIARAYQVLLSQPDEPVAQLYSRALTANADLRRIQVDHDQREHSMLAKDAAHLPSADVVFSAGSEAFVRDEITDPSALTYRGMLRVTVPIFSGLSSWSERRERQLTVLALRQEEQTQKNKLFEDIHRYQQQSLLALEQMQAEEANVRLATESIRQADLLYRNGAVPLSDVLDAFAQKVEAQRALASSMYSRIEAAIWLRHLTGHLHASIFGEEKHAG